VPELISLRFLFTEINTSHLLIRICGMWGVVMWYIQNRGNRAPQKDPVMMYGVMLLFVLLVTGVVAGTAWADTQKKGDAESGPDVAIIDATVKMDISDMEEISLGTIPDERLIVTITVKNTGNREAPGYKLRAYLVRVGREDEIGTQIGGDITDTRLAAGEVRTYTKSWSMPAHLKKGEYRVMIVLDTSNYFIEPDTDNNRITSQQPVVPGALTGPEGAVPVYSPAEITKPGYYVLKRDIDGIKKLNVFEIKASGVTFDGGGNTIRGRSTGFTSGIYINAGTALNDITIKNVVIEGTDAGIWMYKASNCVISNCTFRNAANMGLRLDQSNQNRIFDNIFEKNGIGIGVFQSKDNVIFNNIFKNKHNAVVNEDQRNMWNTDLKSGTNIIGGSMTGGNAWFDETGEGGFSATAQDYTHDGISDTPYSLNANNIDLYPLSRATPGKPTLPVTSLPVTPAPTETPVLEWIDTKPENSSEEAIPAPDAQYPVTDTTGTMPAETMAAPLQTEETQQPGPDSTENTSEGTSTPPAGDMQPEESDANITSLLSKPSEPLSPYADISVKEVSGPEKGCPGTEFTMSAVIENTGGYDADAFQVRFYLTEDRQIDNRDIFLGEKTVKNLLSESEQTITESFTIPQLIGLKNYYLAIVTNTDNAVFEDKKENNTGFSTVRMAVREC